MVGIQRQMPESGMHLKDARTFAKRTVATIIQTFVVETSMIVWPKMVDL